MASPPTIGPYRVVRPLGQGGMGEVVLAYDERLHRHVALKSVLAAGENDGRDALLNEARAAAALSHPGIAAIFDIIEEQDRAYIVMEYVEGETLASRLRNGPLQRADAIELAGQLCAALSAAHAQHVIHRDLKPGNIMITAGGQAKILDFGLAKRVPLVSPSSVTFAPSTIVGRGGTPGYMTPEQVLGEPTDERCDIFSLGAVLFEMFTGTRAFPERDLMAYGVRVTTTHAPSAIERNASIGLPISKVIAKAMARDPRHRYDTVVALNRALQDAAGLPATQTMPLTQRVLARYSRTRLAVMTAGLAVVIAVAVALVAVPRSAALRAVPEHPAVLAILPASALDVDPTLRAVAAGVTSVVTANLGSVSGLNVVAGVAPASAADSVVDAQAAMERVGAGAALEMSLRPANGGISARAAIRKAGAESPLWHSEFEGDALTITRRMLLGVAQGVVDAGLVPRLSDETRRRLLAMPTNDTAAFIDYARGRLQLNGVINADAINRSLEFFEAAAARDPRFALALAGLSDSLRRRYQQDRNPGDMEGAIDAANRAVALDPDDAAVQLTRSSVLNATGRTAEALVAADRAIALQPSSDAAHRARGSLLVQSGRRDEGIAALQHAVDLRPNYYANYESLGFSLYRIGRLEEAANAYRKVTELAPEFANGYQMLGTTLHALGRTEEAVGHYEHAVRLGPSATAYSNLAYSYYETGRYQDALAAYQEAIKREPRRPMTHRNIGDVYARLGRPAEARAAYETAIATGEGLLKVNANDASTIALVALVEAKLGRSLAAERHAAEALALSPKTIDVVVKNAEVYAILRQPSRALTALQNALALGYDVTAAAKNEELQSLKGRPEFAKLVAATPPN